MNENVVSSKKINLSKKIKIAWIIIAAILIAVSVFSVIKYSKYKKGQEMAVAFTLATTSHFDKYKDNYEKMVEEMYEEFNPTPFSTKVYGKTIDNSNVVKAARSADQTLGTLLSNEGYDCYYGSTYLKYVGFVDYTVNNNVIPFIVWGALAILFGAAHLWYFFDKRKEMIIDADRIICKKGKKTAKEFLVKDVKSIELASLKGLKFSGNAFKYRINLLANAEELKTTIMDSLAALPPETSVATEIKQEILPSSADELKKYKELLDNGIISQEEFDAKKKQLLGL